MTTDITIFVIPNTRYHYGLERRLFNVATSRAKEHTIIVVDRSVFEHKEVDRDVMQFLHCLAGEKLSSKAVDVEIGKDNEIDILQYENNKHPNSGAEVVVVTKTNSDVYDLARLQESLNNLQVKLMQWLVSWLPIIYSVNMWRDGVIKKLSEVQYRSVKTLGISSVEGLDLNELLSVFIGNFREFQSASHIHQDLQTLAFHVRDIRHDNAHRRTNEIINMDVSDIKYHIDTIDRFLVGLGRAINPESKKPKITVRTSDAKK